ncbi:MAG: penA [Herminiimonas sp.]|nr:penA [Herminiimonas sp.]MDB5852553.1 penA [Herminiimonas sp.]
MKRREFTINMGAGLAALAIGGYPLGSSASSDAPSVPTPSSMDALQERLRAIEQRAEGGRLGVSVLDTQTGKASAWRGDERFPLCSTFKLLAAGLVLQRVDAGHEKLQRRIRFEHADLVPYSPTTERHVGGDGMTLAELCEAAITLSDNTAGNLMLRSFGGPKNLTQWLRSLGDKSTRLDRVEPDLNEALAGDPRDTTTPNFMLSTMRAIVLGPVLSSNSRAQIMQWLAANKTGDRRLRALLPDGWKVADKTGSGENGTSNDSGLLFPPGRAPVLVAAYLTGSRATATERDAILAQVGSAVAAFVKEQ